jgi:hypothetical protein
MFLFLGSTKVPQKKSLHPRYKLPSEKIVNLSANLLQIDSFTSRYGDGECVTSKDEIIIVEKLLAYHPRAEDKIGCGLDAIMVSHYYQLLNIFRNYCCYIRSIEYLRLFRPPPTGHCISDSHYVRFGPYAVVLP